MTRSILLLGLVIWGPLVAGALATFVLFIEPVEAAISAVQQENAGLDRRLSELHGIAFNLNQRRAEQEEVEQKLAAAKLHQTLINELDAQPSRPLSVTGVAQSREKLEAFVEALARSAPGTALRSATTDRQSLAFEVLVPRAP